MTVSVGPGVWGLQLAVNFYVLYASMYTINAIMSMIPASTVVSNCSKYRTPDYVQHTFVTRYIVDVCVPMW